MAGRGWWQHNYGWSWLVEDVVEDGRGWLWMVVQFSNAYLETCVTLAYSEPCHIQNPGIFRT